MPSKKLRVGDVRHAPVNDHAGVQHLERVLHAAFAAEQAAQRLQIQHVAFVRAQDQPDVGHHQKRRQAEKRPRALRHRGVREDQRRQIRAQRSQNRSDRRANQPPQARLPQPQLEEDDSQGEQQAARRARIPCDTLNGRKWKPAAAHTAMKTMRIASMSQNVPT